MPQEFKEVSEYKSLADFLDKGTTYLENDKAEKPENLR